MSALSIYALKPRFQALLRPLAAALARGGVTANQVTLAAAVVSVVARRLRRVARAGALAVPAVPLWMFVRMALNAIDGMLAREFGQKSRLGAYLNELGDVVSDAALYAAVRAASRRSRPGRIGVVIVLRGDQRIRRRARPAGRRVAPLRRPDGQERPRVRVRRARPVGRPRRRAARRGSRWLMPVARRAARRHDRQPRARGLAEARGADAMNDTVRACASSTRTVARAHVSHARRRRPLLSPLAGARRGTPRGAIVLFHRGHEHSRPHGASRRRARPARLRLLRLGRARPRPLARRARRLAELRHVGARRADVRRPHRRRARLRGRGHRGHRAERRRGAGRRRGCTTTRRSIRVHGARLAGVQGEALRAVRACRARGCMHKLRGNFFVNSYVKAKFLTHDPERIASLRRRSADHARRSPSTSCSASTRRPSASSPTRAAITVPTQLLISGADWVVHHAPQHAFFERLGAARQGAARPARLLSRHAGRARPRATPSPSARAFLLRALRRRRRAGPTCATPTASATRATRPTRWRRRCRALSPRGLYWALTRAEPAARRPAVGGHSRSATRPGSIPAARSTTSTATRRAGVTAARPR